MDPREIYIRMSRTMSWEAGSWLLVPSVTLTFYDVLGKVAPVFLFLKHGQYFFFYLPCKV